MLNYILQTIIFQLLFLLVYDVFLKKETFFNWNRFYLLASALLSVILPFIKISSFKEIIAQDFIFRLPELIIGNPENSINLMENIELNQVVTAFVFKWEYVLYLGCLAALALFITKLIKLLILVHKNPKINFKNYVLVELLNTTSAFSFFNYIFLGSEIKNENKQAVLAHELEHVKQKHTLDLLFFEALRILFWFNPLIYMYQKRIANLHEFIADAKAVKLNSKHSYYQNLLSQVFDTKKVSFINPFFKQSLIKKRIVMLSKSKSKQIHLAKYLLVIPMVIGMLFYTSAEGQTKTNQTETSNINEKELLVKYKKEIKDLYDEEGRYSAIKDIGLLGDNYLKTIEEFVKAKATMQFIFERMEEQGKDKKNKFVDSIFKKKVNISYSKYLENKKTQEYKDNWENGIKIGNLRMLVNNLDNITIKEQKLIDSKIIQIKNDEWYHTLVISDGYRHKNLEFENQLFDKKGNLKEIVMENETVSFAVIDQVPIYPNCENLIGTDDLKRCFSDNISTFVAKNFNTSLGKKLKLSGLQKISALFTIDKEGKVMNINIRAEHPELEVELRRIINLLPIFKPGKQDGKAVNVTFFLPVKFNINE